MARTTFSGPVKSDNGFEGNITGTTASATGTVTALSGSAATAGGAAAFLATTTSGGLGVYVGSGAPSATAAQGSLYLRTDGTTTNDRLYIRGASSWIAITTAS